MTTALQRWAAFVADVQRTETRRGSLLAACCRLEGSRYLSHGFHRWLSAVHVAGIDSAWRQHLLQHNPNQEHGAQGHEAATASETQPARETTHPPHMSASGVGVGEEGVLTSGPLSAGHGAESHALQSSLDDASPALGASPADLNASLP